MSERPFKVGDRVYAVGLMDAGIVSKVIKGGFLVQWDTGQEGVIADGTVAMSAIHHAKPFEGAFDDLARHLSQ